MRNGFTSLAIIPIRYRGQVLGAIHIADEREGMTPLNVVEFIESISPLIGEAIHRFNIEEELRRNYEALRQSSELFENMFSNIYVMIAYLDINFNFIFVNKAYAQANGHEPEYFIGKNHFDLFPDTENEKIFKRVAETGEPYFAYEKPFEYSEHPERGIAYLDFSLVPIKDDSGVNGLILSLIDVTERKEAETERAKLVKVVEEATEAIVITDTKGIIKYVNPAFEKITGYEKVASIGRDIHFLDSGKHDESFFSSIRETLQLSDVWRGTIINRRKDGTLYHEECSISAIRDSSGEIINYVSIKRDVTEKLRLESIAEAVNTMENIGYIFTGIRHEIGNPINSIKMTLSVLKANLEEYTRSTVREYIERAQGELSRIEYLLRNLRAFNMYENPELQSLNISDFMNKLVSLIKDDFKKKGIIVEIEIVPDAKFCYADPRALQQVMLNVFTNASDALYGKENPRISINVSKLYNMIRIQVADNGSGMTEDELMKIFKPFYTTKAHGTGLGLVIARRTLAKMNGIIDIKSQKNVGTKVNIYIPEGRVGTG